MERVATQAGNDRGKPSAADVETQTISRPFGSITILKLADYGLYRCFHEKGRFTYIRSVGVGTLEAIKSVRIALFAHGAPKPGIKTLVDSRWVHAPLRFSEMHDLVKSYESHAEPPQGGPGKMAIVADKDFGFAMARMYESMSSGIHAEVGTFRDVASALEFLGVEPDVLAEITAELDKLEG